MAVQLKTILFAGLCLLLLPSFAHASSISWPANNLGLVGYWSFNEGTSTIAHDSSGKKNNGTLSGTTLPTWVAGKLGKALNFSATNGSFVNVTNASSLNPSVVTVSAWFKVSSVASRPHLVGKGGSSAGAYWLVIETNGTPSFYYTLSSGTWSNVGGTVNEIVANTWYYIVGVYDGSTAYIYINGQLVNSSSAPGTLSTTDTNPVWIAKNSSGSPSVNGTIDEVRIYNRALSATQIAALYKTGAARVNSAQAPGTLGSGLVGWWTMDGADTHWTSPTAGVEYDKSGQNNTGTLTSMARATAVVIGKVGQALKFNGSNYIDAGSTVGLFGTSNYSLSGWVKTSVSSRSDIINRYSGPGGSSEKGWYIDVLATGLVRTAFETDGSDYIYHDSAVAVNDGRWHHVVVVRSGSSLNVYIDGTQSGSQTTLGSPTSSDAAAGTHLTIGGNTPFGANLIGTIDDVRIYNRALSANEVKQLYNIGAGTHANTSSTNLQNGSSLASGLVGLWTFDGSTVNWATGVVKDLSGQGNNGSLINMSTTTSPTIGKLGQALKFRGSPDAYVSVPHNATLNVTSVTIAAWIKRTSNSEPSIASIVSKYCPSGNYAFRLNGGANNTLNFTNAGQNLNGSTTIPLNTWTFVTATFSNATLTGKLYINATQDGSNYSFVGGISQGSSPVCIGTDYLADGTRNFIGSIDDVRIYNRALSATEVKQLYNMGK